MTENVQHHDVNYISNGPNRVKLNSVVKIQNNRSCCQMRWLRKGGLEEKETDGRLYATQQKATLRVKLRRKQRMALHVNRR